MNELKLKLQKEIPGVEWRISGDKYSVFASIAFNYAYVSEDERIQWKGVVYDSIKEFKGSLSAIARDINKALR